ncbi:hypothetical protein PSHT_03057 [Puccinia striiformis]|uniref:DUF4219 domain-containing protein n=1 Tax=Puccinia striiformis TaxID=27350 RepID=A0A2S4WGA2_9BASI|nr:hypothetical protein PSHT_03057 [Puccinia striiformis]
MYACIPMLTADTFPIWQKRMIAYLQHKRLWEFCQNHQEETPSRAIMTQRHEASYRIGCKIPDNIYMGIFIGHDHDPYEIWRDFEGNIPEFIIDIENCLAHYECIGTNVNDMNICFPILTKITNKRPGLTDHLWDLIADQPDPYVLLEKIRPLKLYAIHNTSYWSENADEERVSPAAVTNIRRRMRPPSGCKGGTHNPEATHTQDQCRSLHPELTHENKRRILNRPSNQVAYTGIFTA